jgi:hypothetical protein
MTRYLLLFDSYNLILGGGLSLTRGRVCLLYNMLLAKFFWESRYIARYGPHRKHSYILRTYQLDIENPIPTVARRGPYRKHSLIYCCVLDHVYIAVGWQRFDQICYNTKQDKEETESLILSNKGPLGKLAVAGTQTRHLQKLQATPQYPYIM